MAVLTASMFTYYLLSFSLPSAGARYLEARRCQVEAEATPIPPNASELDREIIVLRRQDACFRPARLWHASVVVAGVLGLLLVALAVYVLVPVWKIRRRRLVPLGEADAPELVAGFHELSLQAGLARPPELLWNPLVSRGDAVAFGRFKRSYVAVGAGLVVQYYTDTQAARAVLRHEVAHVVNRDVSKTYVALSLWYAFVAAAVLPLLVVELTEGTVLTFDSLWRIAALSVLVYVTRNAVLRAREYYADAWAGAPEPARVALTGILRGRTRQRPSTLRRLLGVHPDPGSRVRALKDTDNLFRPKLGDALAAGVLAGAAYPTVSFLLFLLVPAHSALYTEVGAALVSAPLIGVVLGTVVWRASLAARARDGPSPRVAPVALAAALGFVVGSRLALLPREMTLRSFLVLSGLMLVTVHWLVATADAWFDAVPRTRSGRLFSAAAPTAAALVVWSTAWVSFIGAKRPGGPEWSLLEHGAYIAHHSFTPFVIASLVLFSLAASLLRRRVRTDVAPSWVIADGTPAQPARWPPRPPLAVGSALRWGSYGGAVFCLAVLALRALDVSPRSLIKPIDEAAFSYAPVLDYALVTLAVFAQAVVFALVALRARRLPSLHALLALPATFLLMTVAIVIPHVLDGEGLPSHTSRVARLVLTGGAIAALVVGGAVDALRRHRGREAEPLFRHELSDVTVEEGTVR